LGLLRRTYYVPGGARQYEALAEELGEDDVNAVQVFSGLVAEAERSHRLTRQTGDGNDMSKTWIGVAYAYRWDEAAGTLPTW
jgi:hypothetical protein